MSSKPAFPPLDIDAFDARLDQRAAAKGIPTLQTPRSDDTPVRLPAAKAVSPNDEPDNPLADLAGERTDISDATVKAPRRMRAEAHVPSDRLQVPAAEVAVKTRMRPLNVDIPDYLWLELKIRSAQKNVCVRNLVLSALKRAGFTIADADMAEDGRRLR